MAKLLRIPHVWHLREFGEGKDYDNYFYFGEKLSGKFMSYTSDCVVAISHAIKNYYATIIKRREIEIIYDWISFGEERTFSTFKKDARKINLCVVGRISRGKNQMEVLKALKFLRESVREQILLYIIGDGDAKYLSAMYDFIKMNDLFAYVKILGFREDVYSLLEKMHIGVVAYKSEGFGLVTVEYMMHNVAVIASNSGANVELVQNKKNGLIYSLGDYLELANKIDLLVGNAVFREYLAKKAFKYAKEQFHSKICAKKVYNIYQKLLFGN